MFEMLSKLKGDELAPLLGICGVLVVVVTVAVTAIIASNVRKYRQAELDASLKQEMLNRGMSAEDIKQVICAKSFEESRRDRKHRQAAQVS